MKKKITRKREKKKTVSRTYRMTPEQLEIIQRKAAADGRDETNYVIHRATS